MILWEGDCTLLSLGFFICIKQIMIAICVQDEYPLSNMLGTRTILDFGMFQTLEYLQIYSEISGG
jgi:hypothetical protein